MVQKIKNKLEKLLDKYINSNIDTVKEIGFHYVILVDILFYWRFKHHAFRHLTRNLDILTWTLKFQYDEKEWLLFYLPTLLQTIDEDKLKNKIEEILSDSKTPNCLYQAVEHVSENIEEFNIHEVFK